jgi:hypothetical protein
MGKFGEFLLEQGAIREHQLEEAVRFQAVYGGRMGTVVADLGYLVIEELAAYLSDFLHVPLPPNDWLESPDERAIHIIPMPLIRRIKALPIKLEGSKIHVVMMDPASEEHLEFLNMASEREVVPYVLPERKLYYWLELHLGIDRHPRFLGMVTRPRGRELSDEEIEASTPLAAVRQNVEANRTTTDPAERALPVAEAEPVPEEASEADAPLADTPSNEIILLDELVSEPENAAAWEVPSARLDDVGDGRRVSRRVASLEAELYGSSNRDEIMRLGLEIARTCSEAAALFVVRRDLVSGFRADGPDMDPTLAGVELPLATPSIFTHPALTKMPFRGSPPDDGIDGRLMERLGRPDVLEVFVHPIIIHDRTVNLLYADNGGDAFGEISIAGLTALCDCLSRAYERLITEQKKQAASKRVAAS